MIFGLPVLVLAMLHRNIAQVLVLLRSRPLGHWSLPRHLIPVSNR